ncbi:MAG: MATE family efflux transporter [Eubacteriaceae bacterium]|nr:MATE family efflux transporter [Eubacteriaceae bacterium]
MSNKNSSALLKEPVNNIIIKMAVPTIAAQLITTIYNLADTYFVSSLGTSATAAVGVNSSLERMITLIGSLIGSGACSYISRLLGADKKDDADTVLSTSFFTATAAGVVFMIVCSIFINDIVRFLGATEDCIMYSMQYARYVLMAAPFMIGSFILNMCLKSEGSATFAMIGICFGGILNCILDPIFIFGMDLGVAGASMATAISKLVSFVILIYPYIRKRTAVSISLKKIRFVSEQIKEVLSIGSTSFFRSSFMVLSGIISNRIDRGFSTSALAAISVANRVMEFPFFIVPGFGQGFRPVAGFNWGAKEYKRVNDSLNFGMRASVIGAAVMGAVIFIFSHGIIYVFNSGADSEVLRVGMLCMRLQSVVLPIHAWVSVINMFYAGIGKAKYALIMSTARQGYCLIPVLLVLPSLFGVEGLASSQAAADVISFFIVLPLAKKAFGIISEASVNFKSELSDYNDAQALKN